MNLLDLSGHSGYAFIDNIIAFVVPIICIALISAAAEQYFPSYFGVAIKELTGRLTSLGTGLLERVEVSQLISKTILSYRVISFYAFCAFVVNILLYEVSFENSKVAVIRLTTIFLLFFVSALIARFFLRLIIESLTIVRALLLVPLAILCSMLANWTINAIENPLLIALSDAKTDIKLPVVAVMNVFRFQDKNLPAFAIHYNGKDGNKMDLNPLQVFPIEFDPCGKSFKELSNELFQTQNTALVVESEEKIECYSNGVPKLAMLPADIIYKPQRPILRIFMETKPNKSDLVSISSSVEFNVTSTYLSTKPKTVFLLEEYSRYQSAEYRNTEISKDPKLLDRILKKGSSVAFLYLLPYVLILLYLVLCVLISMLKRHVALETRLKLSEKPIILFGGYLILVYIAYFSITTIASATNSYFFLIKGQTP